MGASINGLPCHFDASTRFTRKNKLLLLLLLQNCQFYFLVVFVLIFDFERRPKEIILKIVCLVLYIFYEPFFVFN